MLFKIKGKGIPITGHEGPRGMWMQGSTYSQPRQQDEVGWLVLRSAAFTPGEVPRYSFYRRLSGHQGQSGHEGMKKISTPPTPGIEPGPSSPQPSALPLEPPGPLYKVIKGIMLNIKWMRYLALSTMGSKYNSRLFTLGT